MGTFDFDTLYILQAAAPLVVAPVVQRRPMYRMYDASPPQRRNQTDGSGSPGLSIEGVVGGHSQSARQENTRWMCSCERGHESGAMS